LAGRVTGRTTLTQQNPRCQGTTRAALVSLLIPSHALPPFSYVVPDYLAKEVEVGTAVVAPLSGYGRLGVVVGFEEAGDRQLKEIRAVAEEFSLPESLVKLCSWTAGRAALPLQAVLRMALPPGLNAAVYKVHRSASAWPWRPDAEVGRTELRRVLGGEGLKDAERAGMVVFSPAAPEPRTVEWAVLEDDVASLSRRAHRQRALMQALARQGHGRPVAELLRESGASRGVLRRLVERGAVRLEKRPEPVPVSYTRGSGAELAAYREEAERGLRRGGAWVWRMPDADGVLAVAAVVKAAARRGDQALVLAPEIETVDRLVGAFERLLPAGLTVAPYHSTLGRRRCAVYEAARRGEVDVLVGTRAAVLVPVERLGTVCVVDEPNEAHRGSSGYEGVPIHVRDPAMMRGRIEDAAVFFFSPTPSLRLYALESGARHLPPVEPARWPSVGIVDVRGTGASLSVDLLEACRRTVHAKGRVGVVVNRLGHASALSCNRCGSVRRCPRCGLPLALHGPGSLFCGRCGHGESAPKECPDCGSDRLDSTGYGVERVRSELAGSLGVEVGLLTADVREGEGTPVVVGTARCVLDEKWDLVAIPDADSLLFGGAGSVEKGFRLLYRSAMASRERLVVQTRSPEHHALVTALRGDYEAFADEELPKRRSLGYPPHAHLAEIAFEGGEKTVRLAVESWLKPYLRNGVEMLGPVPFPGKGGRPVWRVLLKSRQTGTLVEAAALVAKETAECRGGSGGLKARINMDPEEA